MGRGKWQIEHLLMQPINWKWFEVLTAMNRVRWFKRLMPWYRSEGLSLYSIPINRDIHLEEGTPLPLDIIYELIDRAGHRVVVDHCLCRGALACEKYPADIACLMMGNSALEIDPGIRREVSPEAAREHVRRAVEAGLVPFAGKVRMDNFVFGIKNKRQLLSVCFCCECCSITRFARHLPAASRSENLYVLRGIRLEVGDECDGCGACAAVCFLQEIVVDGGRASIGEGCAACGRCATACHRGAITISLDNPGMVSEVCDHIEEMIDIR